MYLSLALVFFILILIISTTKLKTKQSPPGPSKLPLIGNIHHFTFHNQSPLHHILKQMSIKHGPILHLKLGEISTFVITSAELAKQIFKDHDLIFAQRFQTLATKILSYNSTDIVFSEYGNYWRHLRKLCILELLSSKRVESFRSIREEGVMNLVKRISENCRGGAAVNVSELIISSSYGITAKAAFGKKCRDQEEFISCVKENVKMLGGFFVADMFPTLGVFSVFTGLKQRLENLRRRNDGILSAIIEEHREGMASDDDLVDVLLRVQKNGSLPFTLTDDNLKAVILDVFSAGSETSSTTIEWALSELIKNPKMMQKSQQQIRRHIFNQNHHIDESIIHKLPYLQQIIKETLRLHPPAPLLVPRESIKACEIGGYKIPANSRIIINAWAIAQSLEYWEEGERFYPERFEKNEVDFKGNDFQFIPFGAGRRICPGVNFAIANIELTLAELLCRFDWSVVDGRNEDLDMSEEFGLTVRRKNDLYLIAKPYYVP